MGEAFNVAHVEPLTQRTYVELLARVAGFEPELVPVSRERIRAAGGQLAGPRMHFGEALDRPSMTERVEKARRVLGLTPTPIEDAFRATYAWYLTQPRRAMDYAFEDELLGRVRR